MSDVVHGTALSHAGEGRAVSRADQATGLVRAGQPGLPANRLDQLVHETPVRSYRWIAWIVVCLVGAFIVWARFANLDEVAIATGEVIPSGQVKVVQHLEGGIVQNIYVRDGDRVVEGQPLVQLDILASQANQHELEVSLDALLLSRARLEAEARDERLSLPPEVAARQPEIALNERQSYDGRKLELDSTLAVLNEQVNQRENDLEEALNRQTGYREQLRLAEERFAMAESLMPDQLISRVEYLEAQQAVERLRSDVNAIGPAITRARAALSEARERVNEKRTSFRREALEQLSQRELEIARVRESLAKAQDTTRRTEIVSPIDGVVKNLRYNTVGGVVRPGESIMEVVPTSDKLVVQARLSPTDIGYIRIGQPAMVKISTYDFARYGGLNGEVRYVSADSFTPQEGESYFEVHVETERAYLGANDGEYPIAPGMQATVDIHTGAKTVMDYLLKPVLKLQAEAFRER